MTTMRKIIRPLVCVAAAMLVTACSSTKRMQEYADKNSTRAVQEQYGAAIQNAFTFDCLQAKARFTLPGKPGINGRINIEQGKRFRLILNAPLLGFEVGRIEVDRDSVTIVNKMDKTYAVESITKVKFDGENNVDVHLLTCLFLGRIYVPGRGEAHVNDYKRMTWQRAEGDYVTGQYTGQKFRIDYQVDARGQLRQTKVTTEAGHTAIWNYDSFTPVTGGIAPADESLNLNLPARQIEAKVTLSALNPKADKWDPFDPEEGNFRRVEIGELWNILQKLMSK